MLLLSLRSSRRSSLRIRIIAWVTEKARLVRKYELARLSFPIIKLPARRFAPHPISPNSFTCEEKSRTLKGGQ